MLSENKLYAARKGDTKVFLVKDGHKHWLTNEEVVKNLGYDWSDVEYVDLESLSGIPTGRLMTSVNQEFFESPDYLCCIEKTWSSDHDVGIVGWAVGKKRDIEDFTIRVGSQERPVTHWVVRSDVFDYLSNHEDFLAKEKCGFQVVVPRKARHDLAFTINGGKFCEGSSYESARRIVPAGYPVDKNLTQKFYDIVNQNKLSVLEIGSRIPPGGVNKRDFLKNAREFVGFDILAAETVDHVGDAHELQKYFPKKKFDALYSDSVLEHLAMPWKAVVAFNQVLNMGGYVYHSAPSCWPLHDLPWDFWRFSDAGMRALFSEPFGFRVIDVGYISPVNVYQDHLRDDHATIPLAPSFGFVEVLAEKISDVKARKVRFNYPLKDVVGEETVYPQWAK
ncbi:MAG: methyltransferase domain-containing protein [Thermoleophilia bacterium]